MGLFIVNIFLIAYLLVYLFMTFEEFDRLMMKWRDDVSFQSSHAAMKKHANYDKIIEYAGQSPENKQEIIGYTCLLLVSPYIHECIILLGELVDNPPPFDPYYAGRVPVWRECWRHWALKEGIVSTKHDVSSYWVEDKNGNGGNWH